MERISPSACGYSDKDRQFFPNGLAVTTAETTEDFEFIFKSLKVAYHSEYPEEAYCPSVLVADGAEAITNAAICEFGIDFTRVCWAHVIRNVDDNMHRIRDKDLRKLIRADICKVQLTQT